MAVKFFIGFGAAVVVAQLVVIGYRSLFVEDHHDDAVDFKGLALSILLLKAAMGGKNKPDTDDVARAFDILQDWSVHPSVQPSGDEEVITVESVYAFFSRFDAGMTRGDAEHAISLSDSNADYDISRPEFVKTAAYDGSWHAKTEFKKAFDLYNTVKYYVGKPAHTSKKDEELDFCDFLAVLVVLGEFETEIASPDPDLPAYPVFKSEEYCDAIREESVNFRLAFLTFDVDGDDVISKQEFASKMTTMFDKLKQGIETAEQQIVRAIATVKLEADSSSK